MSVVSIVLELQGACKGWAWERSVLLWQSVRPIVQSFKVFAALCWHCFRVFDSNWVFDRI